MLPDLTSDALEEFRHLKYGAWVHYVWGGQAYPATRRPDGSLPDSLNDLADQFEAVGFADDLAAWGVQYVILTAWHANINPLFPSATMARWGLADHAPRRDVLGDAIRACRAKNIPVFLYTHPRDGHDLRGEDQAKTGWVPGEAANPDWSRWDRQKWNDFTNELYAEVVARYGADISGIYLDEGSVAGDSERVVDYPRLRATIKGRHPHLVMIQNYYGNVYSSDVGDDEHGGEWQSFGTPDGDQWTASTRPQAVVFATEWWAVTPMDRSATRFSVETMFRFTVLQAGTNTDGGGTQWSAGPYAGGGWETGVDEAMRRVGSLVEAVAPSIKRTVPSQSFLTAHGAKIADLAWGVATASPDGRFEYLHVLKAPTEGERTLRVGEPCDGKKFISAVLLPGGQTVELAAGPGSLELTLPPAIAWDALDTVIRLESAR